MAGGLVTAWRFFGQFRLPHLFSRLGRPTTNRRLEACFRQCNAASSGACDTLDFDDELRIEGCPLSRIPERIGQHPRPPDTVIDLLMNVTMHPQ